MGTTSPREDNRPKAGAQQSSHDRNHREIIVGIGRVGHDDQGEKTEETQT